MRIREIAQARLRYGYRKIRVLLKRLKLDCGVLKVLFCDNGSEFTNQAMALWAYRNRAKVDFSSPGKPTDVVFVESVSGTFRRAEQNSPESGARVWEAH